MTTFLLDANLSPKTAQFLTATFGFDVVSLLATQQGTLRDADVVVVARREGRTIITLDLDFGELYHERRPLGIGVIILRLEDQTVASVNRALARFFRSVAASIDLSRSLVIIEEARVRVRQEEHEE